MTKRERRWISQYYQFPNERGVARDVMKALGMKQQNELYGLLNKYHKFLDKQKMMFDE